MKSSRPMMNIKEIVDKLGLDLVTSLRLGQSAVVYETYS
jgi:hypothetical protein